MCPQSHWHGISASRKPHGDLRRWLFALFGFAAIAALAIYQARHLIGMTTSLSHRHRGRGCVAGISIERAQPGSAILALPRHLAGPLAWLDVSRPARAVSLGTARLAASSRLHLLPRHSGRGVSAVTPSRGHGPARLRSSLSLAPRAHRLPPVRVQEPFSSFIELSLDERVLATVLLALSVKLPAGAACVLAAVCLAL